MLQRRRYRRELKRALRTSFLHGPTLRRLEPRRVLDASFSLLAGDLTLSNFNNEPSLDIQFDSLNNNFVFSLGNGNWQGPLGDTGSGILNIAQADLIGLLNINAGSAVDVQFRGPLPTLNGVVINTGGSVTDAPSTDLQVTNGLLSTTQLPSHLATA